jgi:hypothetical protein
VACPAFQGSGFEVRGSRFRFGFVASSRSLQMILEHLRHPQERVADWAKAARSSRCVGMLWRHPGACSSAKGLRGPPAPSPPFCILHSSFCIPPFILPSSFLRAAMSARSAPGCGTGPELPHGYRPPHGRKRGEKGAVGLWTNALHHFRFQDFTVSVFQRFSFCPSNFCFPLSQFLLFPCAKAHPAGALPPRFQKSPGPTQKTWPRWCA